MVLPKGAHVIIVGGPYKECIGRVLDNAGPGKYWIALLDDDPKAPRIEVAIGRMWIEEAVESVVQSERRDT